MTNQKCYIVTGGAGFIGSCFVGQMVEQGAKVVVLDALTYAGFKENLEWIDHEDYAGNYALVEGSITDGALVAELLGQHQPDAVFHFAAESHVDNSIAAPSAFIQTNIVGSYILLEAARAYYESLNEARKASFRFVQVSTDEVYGSLGETGAFHEAYPMQPNSPYSASKAAGDHLARAWFHTYGLPTIVTNCTNNYGARQYPEKLIPLMITHALSGKSLPIYGDGKNIRDWIHVADHCRGVWLAYERGNPGETYCFGGRAERTNIEVVHALCDVLDDVRPASGGVSYREQITFVKDRLGHDRRYAIDDSKAEQQLGFTLAYHFEQGLRDTIQWYLDHQEWCAAVTGDHSQYAA